MAKQRTRIDPADPFVSEYYKRVKKGVDRLLAAQDELDAQLAREHRYPVWAFETAEEFDERLARVHKQARERGRSLPTADAVAADARVARERVRVILRAIEYAPNQRATETLVRAGLVGASRDTLALARSVTARREELRVILAAGNGYEVPVADAEERAADKRATKDPRIEPESNRRNRGLHRVALSRVKLGHLHAQQAARQILVLDLAPLRANFYWKRLPKRDYLSVADARVRVLAALGPAQGAGELALLDALDPDERLMVPRGDLLDAQVNVVLPEHIVTLRASLPILYPAEPGDPLPELVPLPPVPGQGRGARAKRSDRRYDGKPYLKSIDAYRQSGS